MYPAPNNPKIPLIEYPEEETSAEVDVPDQEVERGMCSLSFAADATLPKRKKVVKIKSKERFIELLNKY